jgi:hypothetical protein
MSGVIAGAENGANARPGPGVQDPAELVIRNAKVHTGDRRRPAASAVAITSGVFAAVGDESAVAGRIGPGTRVVDALGRRVIPGLNDSHMNVIRGRNQLPAGTPVGRGPLPGRWVADAARSGRTDSGRPVGPRGRRMERRPVRREAAADGGRAERGGPRHCGAGVTPVPGGDHEPGGLGRGRFHQRRSGPARRADSDQADPQAYFGPVTGPAQQIAVQPESPGQPRDPTRLASYSAHRVTTSLSGDRTRRCATGTRHPVLGSRLWVRYGHSPSLRYRAARAAGRSCRGRRPLGRGACQVGVRTWQALSGRL